MNPGGMPFNEWLKDLGIGEVSGTIGVLSNQ